jgi:hypothetical protein
MQVIGVGFLVCRRLIVIGSGRLGRRVRRLLVIQTMRDYAEEEGGNQHCCEKCEHSDGIHGDFLE